MNGNNKTVAEKFVQRGSLKVVEWLQLLKSSENVHIFKIVCYANDRNLVGESSNGKK